MWPILFLATILRLIMFNQSLWLDEASEALALMGKSSSLFSYILADYQPPIYHAISYVFTHLFGYSEIVLRLPSLISSLLTVYFIMKIAEFIGNKKLRIIAGLLASTSPLLIYYSQEGRTYAMTTFFVTASFYYFIKLLSSKIYDRRSMIYYLIFTILFLWTSYLSWFLLLAEGVYVLWKKRYDLLLLQTIATLTLLAWLPSFITSIGIGRYTLGLSSAWGAVVGGLTWKSLPLTWVKFGIGRISFDNKIIYAAVVGALAVLHFLVLKRVDWKKYQILLWWALPPLALGLLISSILPVFSYFRVLFILPAYILLLSLGLSTFKKNHLLISLVTLNLIFLSIYWLFPRFRHEDWRSLSRDLLQDPSSRIAMPSREQSTPLLYYHITTPIIEPSHESLSGQRFYYIRYAEDLFDTAGLGQANFISSGYTITSERSYPGIQVDIYEKP